MGVGGKVVVPQKYSTLLRGSNKLPAPFQPPDHEQLGINSPFDKYFPGNQAVDDSDYRPPRFAVPAKIDTQKELYDDNERDFECSDDEEALKTSYASVIQCLKGGVENTTVYHTSMFRPQAYSAQQEPQSPQYHVHEYLQQQNNRMHYAAFQQSHALQHDRASPHQQASDPMRTMQYQAFQNSRAAPRDDADDEPVLHAPHIPTYMRADGGIRADMAYQQAQAVVNAMAPAPQAPGKAPGGSGTKAEVDPGRVQNPKLQEALQARHLQDWLQQGVGAYMPCPILFI